MRKLLASFLLLLTFTASAQIVPDYLRRPLTFCNPGEVLTQQTSSATRTTCVTPPGAPGGSDTYVQFNDSSSFGGDSGLRYDKTNDYLGIGGAAGADAKIRISGTTGTSGLLTYRGIYEHQNIGAGAFGYSGVTVDPTTAASAAPTTMVEFLANDVTLGAGASVQNLTGFYSQVSSGTNNYGFYSNVPVGANNYAFYANGTARSQFGAQGIILAPLTGAPSTLTNGAMWYDDTGSDAFSGRVNGATRQFQLAPTTGSPSSSTYLRGDDTWATISGVGSPLANNGEIYIYSGGATAALGAPATGNMGLVGSSTISNSKMRWERGLDDARYRSHYHTDFRNTTTTATAGTLGSYIVTSITNAGGVGPGFPFSGDDGLLQFDVTTTSPQQGAGAGIQFNSGSNRMIRMTNSGLNLWRATFLLVMPANAPDGTNNYVEKVGLSDTFGGGTGSNELYVDLTSGTNSGKWVIHEIHAGNVTTAVNSSATVCGTQTYCEIMFDWSSGSSVTVYQNGVSLGSIVNSIGTSTMLSPTVSFVKTAGSAARSGWWTDFTFDMERTTPIGGGP